MRSVEVGPVILPCGHSTVIEMNEDFSGNNVALPVSFAHCCLFVCTVKIFTCSYIRKYVKTNEVIVIVVQHQHILASAFLLLLGLSMKSKEPQCLCQCPNIYGPAGTCNININSMLQAPKGTPQEMIPLVHLPACLKPAERKTSKVVCSFYKNSTFFQV